MGRREERKRRAAADAVADFTDILDEVLNEEGAGEQKECPPSLSESTSVTLSTATASSSPVSEKLPNEASVRQYARLCAPVAYNAVGGNRTAWEKLPSSFREAFIESTFKILTGKSPKDANPMFVEAAMQEYNRLRSM
jgi:hypothetical protein